MKGNHDRQGQGSLLQRAVNRVLYMGSAIFLGFVLAYVMLFVKVPYYIHKPGSAEDVHGMVQIEQQAAPEKGSFLLTTVGVSEANILMYIWANFHPLNEIRPKSAVLGKDETKAEYNQRQSFNMMASQSTAIMAAYKNLGISYNMHTEGLLVLQTMKNMPAAEQLKAGDYLTSIDGVAIGSRSELLEQLEERNIGDVVEIGYRRGKEENRARITLQELADNPLTGAKSRAGLGITIADVLSVKADDPSKQVAIKAGNIGGPSAGLIFALEIVNRLSAEDITKGYRIAGTGEIDAEGNVGVIGGIQHKVVAADREKADIFFAPKDWIPPEGSNANPILNATTAMERAKKIGTSMEIVPVASLQEALAYLEERSPKQP